MKDILMSPSLIGNIENQLSELEMLYGCTFKSKYGEISGIFMSFSETLKENIVDISVMMLIDDKNFKDALELGEITQVIITHDEDSETIRDIPAGWSQRKELRQTDSGLVFLLSVARTIN